MLQWLRIRSRHTVACICAVEERKLTSRASPRITPTLLLATALQGTMNYANSRGRMTTQSLQPARC